MCGIEFINRLISGELSTTFSYRGKPNRSNSVDASRWFYENFSTSMPLRNRRVSSSVAYL
jgi:hypothetical protein